MSFLDSFSTSKVYLHLLVHVRCMHPQDFVFLDCLVLHSLDVQLCRSQQPQILYGVHYVHVAGYLLRRQLWLGKNVCLTRHPNGQYNL